MPALQTPARTSASITELTSAVLGRPLSLAEAWDLLEGPADDPRPSVWVGSIGYESFKTNGDFATALTQAGVELLIDVRDLPISRKRGFAKTALAEALQGRGVGYLHMKGLGNPKEIRELYKAGDVVGGRAQFERLLRKDRADEIAQLASIVRQKRVALMCVEREESTCHRHSLLRALARQPDLDLEVGRLS